MTSKPNNNFKFACSICTFKNSNAVNFKRHLDDNHAREQHFWCRNCGKVCLDREVYIAHQEEQNCPQVFNNPCGFENCDFSDRDPQRLLYHFKNRHKSQQLIPCKYCKRIFTIPLFLMRHFQSECCNRPNFPSNAPSNQTAESNPPRNVDNCFSKQVSDASRARSSSATLNSTINTNTQVKTTCVSNNNPAKSAKKSIVIKETILEVPKHRSLFNDIDSDPDDPSWQPSSSKSKIVSSHNNEQSRKRSSNTNDLKSAKKVKKTASDSTKVAKDLESGVPMFLSWSSWETKIASFKSPDTLQELLLPANICNFFKCMATACSFSTNVDSEFLTHCKDKHQKEVQICCYCLKKISTCDLLLRHMLTKHSQRKYQCFACLFRAKGKLYVKRHKIAMHAQEQNLAPFRCEQVVSSLDTSDIDPKETEPRVPQTYDCSHCTFNTTMIKTFKDHLLNEHAEAKVFNCSYCGYEMNNLDDFVPHFNQHGLYTSECKFCEFGSENLDDVIEHFCINHADQDIEVSSRGEECDSEVENVKLSLKPDTYSEKVLPQSDSKCEEKITTFTDQLSPKQEQVPVKPHWSLQMPTLKPFDALHIPSNVSSISFKETCRPNQAIGSPSLSSTETLNIAEPDAKSMNHDAETSGHLNLLEPDAKSMNHDASESYAESMDHDTNDAETSDTLNIENPDENSMDHDAETREPRLDIADPDAELTNHDTDDAETSDNNNQTSARGLDKEVDSFSDTQDKCLPCLLFNGHQEFPMENECSNDSLATEKNYACHDSNPTKLESEGMLKDDMFQNLQYDNFDCGLSNKRLSTRLQLKECSIHSDCKETKFCDYNHINGAEDCVDTVTLEPLPKENSLPHDDFCDNSVENYLRGDFNDNSRESFPQDHLVDVSREISPHNSFSDNSSHDHEEESLSTEGKIERDQTSFVISNQYYPRNIILNKQPIVKIENIELLTSRKDSMKSVSSISDTIPANTSISDKIPDPLSDIIPDYFLTSDKITDDISTTSDIIPDDISTTSNIIPDDISTTTSDIIPDDISTTSDIIPDNISTASDTRVTEKYSSSYGQRLAPIDWSSILFQHRVSSSVEYARLNGNKELRIVLEDCILGVKHFLS